MDINSIESDEPRQSSKSKKGFSVWQSLLITVVIMAALLYCVCWVKIPCPDVVMAAGLVICSALFGFTGGIIAAAAAIGHALYYYSTGNNFVSFTSENMQQAAVYAAAIIISMLFVCVLKQRQRALSRKNIQLAEELERENQLLKKVSTIDTLTHTGNRLALRNDYDAYLGKELVVAMMDLDDFKSVNSKYGHLAGDIALKKTGDLLSQAFGSEHCYRYGEDEFLVISPDTDSATFLDKIALVTGQGISADIDDKAIKIDVTYSIGYINGTPIDTSDLRYMLKVSGERLRQAKDNGNGSIVGDHR